MSGGRMTTGYHFFDKKRGCWFARLTFTSSNGKRRNIQRKAETEGEAKKLVKLLIRELEDYGEKSFQADQMTFNDLAAFFTEHYLKEPEYINGRKVSGLRSYKEATYQFKPVQEYFGKKKIKAITHADILAYKLARLKTTTKNGTPRTIATVNRELAHLRRCLQIAVSEGWLIKNPFAKGDLISLADETKRERFLSRQEESRLLAACVKDRAHLKAIIICALDTGMRQGEIFSLKWQNIDLVEGIISIEAFNTKTMKGRQVAISGRLKAELIELNKYSLQDPSSLVFGVQSVKTGWRTACKLANIEGLRFHDLRHTAATRLIQQGIPLQEVGRILGHTQANTTYRYVNANADTAKRAAAALDDFHADTEREEEGKEGRVN